MILYNKRVNLEEYKKDALKTAFYPNMGSNIEYPVLAILEESIEIFEKIELSATKEEIVKELGDLLWYTAMIFYEFKKPFEFTQVDEYTTPSNFIIKSGKLASILKKTLRDNDGIFTEQKLEEFFSIINNMLSFVMNVAAQLGFTLEEVAQINIEKINDRIKRGKLQGSGDNR